MPSPWMAAKDSSYRKIKSFEDTVFSEGFQGILRAGRSESAARRFQGRNADLIESYQEDERRDRDLLKNLQ